MSIPVVYLETTLPDPGPPTPVYLPSIDGGGDSCFETADTGWVCTPIVSDPATANVSLTTYIDLLPAPDDATSLQTLGDPNAPVPVPDATIDVTPNPPNGPSTSGPICSQYGTARWLNGGSSNSGGTLNCPPDHWFKGYYYIDNQASSAWPVAYYTSYWNNNLGGLSVKLGCPSATHCVKVVDGNYGTYYIDRAGHHHPQWLGLTTYTIDAHNRFVSATVQFNDSFGDVAAAHEQAVCHELGHTAGLGHEAQDVSCLWTTADGAHTKASTDDFDQLYYNTYAPYLPT